MRSKFLTTQNHFGFTLLELMVTLAIVAILAALAIPSLGEFAVRNKLSSIGNEFSGSVLRARNEAIGKNTCVTMCMSSTVDASQPACMTSGQDWQVGWIVFLNPSCDVALNKPMKPKLPPATGNEYSPEDMVLVRRPVSDNFIFNAQSSGRKIFFNARGNSRLSDADEFDLVYRAANDPMTLKYGFNICLDSLGRTRTISTSSSC
ncbi:MAG: GspH/FimT family pseudopilin [Rhodoferax sp.]